MEIVVNRLRLFGALSAAAVVCASAPAHAARVGIWVGPGYYPVPVVPAPYYYPPYPPVVAVPAPEQDYVEQGPVNPAPAQPAPQSSGSWYYCDAAKAYYPYVQQCSSGWREVPAQPAPAS